MEKMLINATENEEIRVALIRENKLHDLDIETQSDIKKKGNIYKAVVTRREPSLDAVFVEYGAKRQGFLPIKEISPEYFVKQPEADEKLLVTDLIKEGQELLIQVDKEERGNKGAALTTYITLAGCYLVLMPNNPKSGGISRRIEGDERDELKEALSALQIDEDKGVIIRTAGVGKGHTELQADLDMLCNQWRAISEAYHNELAPCLIHQEGDVIIRSIRDNLRTTVNEIIIDDQVSYVKAKRYIEQVKPEFLPHLKLYNNPVPLFNFYQVESQIETAYQREVLLPSGGALVIDRTEALVSIDINSAKSTGGSDIETTALNTNLEAADEIARQLRLRDLGGLVVIDFIDMNTSKNQREVEARLKDALKSDRARIQVGRISRFGLLEMSRQRLKLSLGESHQDVCPRCEGRGVVRNVKSSSLSIIRLIEEEALKENVNEVQVQLPVDMATFVMNEKRELILSIEKRHKVTVLIIANPYIQPPRYHISRCKGESNGKNKKPSYSLIQQPDVDVIRESAITPEDEPAIKPYDEQELLKLAKPGFLKRLLNTLAGKAEATAEENSQVKKRPHKAHTTKKRAPNKAKHSNNSTNNNSKSGQPRKQPAAKKSHTNSNHKKRTNNNGNNKNTGKVIPLKKEGQAKKTASSTESRD